MVSVKFKFILSFYLFMSKSCQHETENVEWNFDRNKRHLPISVNRIVKTSFFLQMLLR